LKLSLKLSTLIEQNDSELEELIKFAEDTLKTSKIRISPNNIFWVFEKFSLFDDFEGVLPDQKILVRFSKLFNNLGNRNLANQIKSHYKKIKTNKTKNVKYVKVYLSKPVKETNKAIAFSTGKISSTYGKYGPEQELIWFPKSQVSYDEKTGIVEMPIWLAIDKNLRYSE